MNDRIQIQGRKKTILYLFESPLFIYLFKLSTFFSQKYYISRWSILIFFKFNSAFQKQIKLLFKKRFYLFMVIPRIYDKRIIFVTLKFHIIAKKQRIEQRQGESGCKVINHHENCSKKQTKAFCLYIFSEQPTTTCTVLGIKHKRV